MQNLQIQSSPAENQKKDTRISHEVIFFFHGLTSLIGWFVVLNSLQYFHSVYPHSDVYQFFLLPILFGYLTVAIAYKKITEKVRLQRVVVVGLTICSIAMIALLMVSVIFAKAKGFGFALSVLICYIIGVSSNSVQLSYFSLINFVPEKVISRFTIGTAVSGLSLTILKMIIVAISGTSPHFLPVLIYFVIACLVQYFDLILNNKFCNSKFYAQKIHPFLNKGDQASKELNEDTVELPAVEISKNKSYFRQMLDAGKSVFPYPLIIFSNFVITMMMFPDLTVKIRFDFSKVWSSLIFIFLFGLGDTIGKFLVEIKGTFNAKSNIYLILSRLGFFILIPLMASDHFESDPLLNNYLYPFLVLFLFGITNGFTISTSIILISKKCPQQYKQFAGVLSGISLQVGLTLGTILAFPMQLIAE